MKRFGVHNAVLIWMLIFGAFILPGCGGDAGNGHWDKPGTINLNAPTVTAVVPAVNAPAVPINTKIITAAFSKAMDATTLTITSFTLACNGTPITGGGAVTYLDAGFVATLPLPAATDLPGNALCTATITTAATAQDGNALANNYMWTFTTALLADTTRPQVLNTIPATTTPGPTPAISNTPIQAIFTEDMAPASITAPGNMTVTGPGITPVVGAATPVIYDVGTRTATFIPLNPLTDGVTYTVTIKGTGLTPATDVATNALAGNSTLPLVANDYVWSFTPTALEVTIIPGDVCPVDAGPTIPTVTMSDPTSGNQFATTSTMGVVNNGKQIVATFDLAMDPTTIASATAPLTFTIKETASGNSVAGTVTMDATNKIATFTSDAALLPDTAYTASITTDAMSAGIPRTALACPYEWNFKTVTPAATGQMPVPLGSAANFVILASAAITNIPTSAITGDVGLTPDSGSNISGFDQPLTCPEVTGTIYAVDAAGPACAVIDPVLIQNAKDDAEIAFLNARAAVRGTPTSISGDLNGLTFAPGLYESLTSLEISPGGALTLDAQGDVNAVFIIRSETTITTQSTSQVILAGGAKANNVYWTAGSSVTLGTNSIMKGTMIAGTSISLLTGANLEGRALNQGAAAEAITLDQATITLPLP